MRLVALAAFVAQCAWGATWFVDARRGDDKAPGSSPEQPFQTISRAARVARPGDTVAVAPGTYDEQVNVGGFPDATSSTRFVARPPGRAVLAGKAKQFRFSVRRPRVVVEGFVCRDSREHAIDIEAPADNCQVHRCVLTQNRLDGVFFRRCRGGRVVATVCASNGRHGIWFLEAPAGAAINNTLCRNRGAGIAIGRSTRIVVFDSIIAHNGVGIRAHRDAATTLRSDHNLFCGGFIGQMTGPDWLFGARAGTLEDWRELSGQDAHSVEADPALVAPERGDFEPASPPVGNPSPALLDGLRVERLAGLDAAGTDLLGRDASERSRAGVGAVWAEARAQAKPFATIEVPRVGRLSLNILDGQGRIVRAHLRGYPVKEGRLPLFWDGKDELGGKAPPGSYRWLAIVHDVRARDDGSFGDTGNPPYGSTQVSDGVCDLAADPEGYLYEMSFWDEAGHCLRRLKPDSKADWVIPFYVRNVAGGLGTAVATDGRYVFAALVHQRQAKGGRAVRDDVRRLLAADGKPASFPARGQEKPDNLIVINPEKPELWIHAKHYSKQGARRLFGVRGLAVDGRHLYVSNYYRDRLEVHDKQTGEKLREFAVPKPLGLDVAPDGTLWVANSGDRVSQFTPHGEKKAEIVGLKDPYGVDIGGPGNLLYVTEVRAGHIAVYDIPGQPRLVRTIGRPAGGPGRVEPDAFRFGGFCGIAVDARGRVSVCDQGNHRVQRFNPDGSLWQSLYSDFVAAPFVEPGRPEIVLTGNRQYRVDHQTGRWEFTHNWAPADGRFASGKVIRLSLSNGRTYLFHLGGHRMGVVIYVVEGERLRRSAMLGGRWMGTGDLGKGGSAGMYVWRDTNGDGTVEDAEMTWTRRPDGPHAYIALAPGWWVAGSGDLFLADQVTRSIVKLPLLGFDERGNPVYDWTKRQAVVKADASPWKFIAKNLRLTPKGEIYAQGTIEQHRDLGPFWMGGTAVARFAPDGSRRWLLPLPRVAVAIATDGQFWYVAEGPTAKVSMFTSDGLFVCSMAPGKPSGYQSGWIDHAMGICAFALGGERYVLAEEDLFGKVIRYRIGRLDTLVKLGGEFAWPLTR